ncbi:MAG: metal-dependent hydrolase [Microthrixaceae bacterium]
MQVRHPRFDIAGSVPHWGDNAAACTVINGGGIIPPPIERFLIKVMRQAKQLLDPVADAALVEAIGLFNKQEGQHFKLHAEYLDMLAAKGYPRIKEYEAAFEADLDDFLATKPLEWNLGYGEGFESSGPALASGWLDGPIQELCGDHGSEIMRLWMWHMAEEFEHRSVVHDVMDRLYGTERAFGLRTTAGEFARGHYGDHAARAASYMFGVDREHMTDEEVQRSLEAEAQAWLAMGEIGGANFAWIHDRAYDPAAIAEPAGYAAALALG